MQKFEIILFYKYAHIEDPKKLEQEHRTLCEKLQLKGRAIFAHEGINATFEGEKAQVEKYVQFLLSDKRFADTHIKRSEGNGKAFPRLSIKVRSEIVSLKLGEEDIHPSEVTGVHLAPEKLYEWIHNGIKDDFVIVDMRNDYEHQVGKFKGSVTLPMNDFRDLPKVISKLKHLKDKPVVTVCTGGVRCEKASGFLVKQGFQEVYQLDGGIVSYMEKFKNDDFQGKLYVFDDRIAMTHTPDDQRTIVGRCLHCKKPSEQFVNCENDPCHAHFILCSACVKKEGRVFCGLKCKLSPSRQIIDARKVAKRKLRQATTKIRKSFHKTKMKLKYS